MGGAAGLLVGLAVWLSGAWFVRRASPRWQVPELHEAALLPALVGGLLGGLTHPVLDGLMHEGIAPLRPFSTANPFQGAVPYPMLAGSLVAMACVGSVILAVRLRRLPARSTADPEVSSVSATLRILSWNCKGAWAQSAVWDYLLELSRTVALLQEVGELPDRIRAIYAFDPRKAIRPGGDPQPFSTALLVRGRIGEAFSLTGLAPWADAELDRFAGNLICREVIPDGFAPLSAISVYKPAWPIAPEPLVDVDVTGVRLTQNPGLWLGDILWAGLKRLGLGPGERWVVGGDFNLSETFDQASWSAGGNGEYLDRMASLGLVECLRQARGSLTPTFRNASGGAVKHQLEYIFVTQALATRLVSCDTGSGSGISGVRVQVE